MSKIIYSLYIDIPEEELDYQPPYLGETEPKTFKTKRLLREYYEWIKTRHIEYANHCNIEYKLFEYDLTYTRYKEWFNQKYPMITSYNIVNFYKIHCLYELSKQYDEILYIDFDVIPLSNKIFFDHWDLSKGMAILTNRTQVDNSLLRIRKDSVSDTKHSIRSPTAKYWNTKALLIESNMSGINEVYNTGIIGANYESLQKLDYWNNFDSIIKRMTDLKDDKLSMYPSHIQRLFGYDNETIWSYKMKINNVNQQWLTPEWHHFMDKWNYIPANTNLVHVINKNFHYVKNWYEKNNL
jgi:hypothetical protein